MRLALQLVLFCALFTAVVAAVVRDGPLGGLFFYPKSVQERAFQLGLVEREALAHRRTRFMCAFYLVMLAALLLVIRVWDGITDYWPAYWQALLFLEVMNVYDGIVSDKVWVGLSPFWVIPGCEDLPYVQTWAQVARKRLVLAAIWVFGAALVAALAWLLP
jgi:hypothetical protein